MLGHVVRGRGVERLKAGAFNRALTEEGGNATRCGDSGPVQWRAQGSDPGSTFRVPQMWRNRPKRRIQAAQRQRRRVRRGYGPTSSGKYGGNSTNRRYVKGLTNEESAELVGPKTK